MGKKKKNFSVLLVEISFFCFLEYVEPFLDEVSILSNFSVKSQWLYLLPLDVTPKRVPDSSPLGRHFALSEDVLPQLITPLEKKLGSYLHSI